MEDVRTSRMKQSGTAGGREGLAELNQAGGSGQSYLLCGEGDRGRYFPSVQKEVETCGNQISSCPPSWLLS